MTHSHKWTLTTRQQFQEVGIKNYIFEFKTLIRVALLRPKKYFVQKYFSKIF